MQRTRHSLSPEHREYSNISNLFHARSSVQGGMRNSMRQYSHLNLQDKFTKNTMSVKGSLRKPQDDDDSKVLVNDASNSMMGSIEKTIDQQAAPRRARLFSAKARLP